MLQQLGYIHNKFSYLHWHVISKKWYSYTFLHCPADNMHVFYAFRQQPLPAIFDVNKMCFKLSSWFRLNSFLRISSLFEETNSRFHSLMIFIFIYLSARTNMLETQTQLVTRLSRTHIVRRHRCQASLNSHWRE